MVLIELVRGDASERWPLDDNTLDSIVTDPPYGIAFMGKSWDDKGGPQAYQEWTTLWAKEAFRCLKPGGFLLAFGATRMAHRMTCGFEDVGFEILDTIEWLYLSGMTKAQDIGKMMDKRQGAEREVLGENPFTFKGQRGTTLKRDGRKNVRDGGRNPLSAPATDLAKQWDGWKTPSLKPAHEPIVVARKPLIGTYCENIERWGVGAMNVDGCRVSFAVGDGSEQLAAKYPNGKGGAKFSGVLHTDESIHFSHKGRFPANVVMSHAWGCTEHSCIEQCPVRLLDEQSAHLMHSAGAPRKAKRECAPSGRIFKRSGDGQRYGDEGGASKLFAKFFYEEEDFVPFYYCPKASTSDRNAGCEDLPRGNDHATVKPSGLICYLQRLVTPPGGITASPFLGSGTDAVAAIREGFNFWGMNLPDRPGEEYWPIIEARVDHAREKAEESRIKELEATVQPQQTYLSL